MAKSNTLIKTKDIIKSFKSISALEIQQIIEEATEKQIVAIITGINKNEKYWSQEKRWIRYLTPGTTTTKMRYVDYRTCTFDVFIKEKIFKSFADFLLKAVNNLPYLTLHAHQGRFDPIFTIQRLTDDRKNPYLIKFKKGGFPKILYPKMLKILCSKNNTRKHSDFRLKKLNLSLINEY